MRFSAQEVLNALKTKGISIRVASPKLVMEEAPESYKDVTQVSGAASPRCTRRRAHAAALTSTRLGGGHLPCRGDFEEDSEASSDCCHQRLRDACGADSARLFISSLCLRVTRNSARSLATQSTVYS